MYQPLVYRGYYQGMPLPPAATLYLPAVYRRSWSVGSIFGVHMKDVSGANGLQEALDADVRWVRTAAIRWDWIEPVLTSPPTYRWNTVDEASLINAAQNGLRTIAIVFGTPSWAQSVPGYACSPPKQWYLDEFATFLQAAVERYSAPPYAVRHWELGNEPDVDPSLVPPTSQFGCWGDEDDDYYGGGYYAEMLKLAYPAVKDADGSAQVLVGGLLLDCNPENPPPGKDCKPGKFLEGILQGGGGDSFDAVSFHAYSYGGALGFMRNDNWGGSDTSVPQKTSFLRGVLQAYNFPHKGLLNTEAALLCAQNTWDCLETQGMYVARAYAQALAWGLEGQVYYEMINEDWRHVGLLLPTTLEPKPVYHAYTAASSFLGTALYTGPAAGYPAGIVGSAFRQSGQSEKVDVIWSADGSSRAVTLPAGATAYDRYGQKLIPSGRTIQVNFSPVYIVNP